MASFLDNPDLRLLFVGGKGGVGKTTTAVASALQLAEHFPNANLLLLSTDPAHSLGDALEMGVNDFPSSLKGFPSLKVCELNASRLLKEFKERFEKELKLLAERGTYFDSEDIQSFFDLSFPGIDEMMAVLEMARLLEDPSLKCLVVDTAPTGHTLSLFRLPKILDTWLDLFDLMQEKHHILQSHFSGKRETDFVDSFLERMRSDLKRVRYWFHHPTQTQFVAVMLPEMLSLQETRRLVFSLQKQNVPVHHLVINGLVLEGECPLCLGVHKKQLEILAKARELFPSLEISLVPLASTTVQGIPALKRFAEHLTHMSLRSAEGGEAISRENKLETASAAPRSDIGGRSVSLKTFMSGHPQLWIVGGKGGVGKTTIASVTALCLARSQSDQRFLLFSIDPAHSLSDCLDMPIGGRETKILDNLYALELNADHLLEEFRRDYARTIDELLDRFVGGGSSKGGFDLGHDRKVLHGLIEMSPPGIEEMMALYQVIELLKLKVDPSRQRRREGEGFSEPSGFASGERIDTRAPTIDQTTKTGSLKYDAIIFDTAPTGHLFRFLELPHLLKSWLKAIFQLLIKYKQAIPLGEAAQKLVSLSSQVRQILAILEDPQQTRVFLVTKPEAMIVAETKRFEEKLATLHLPLNLMVMNMLRVNKKCTVCQKKKEEQQPFVNMLRNLTPENWVSVPLLAEDIRGVEQLKRLGEMIYYRGSRRPLQWQSHWSLPLTLALLAG